MLEVFLEYKKKKKKRKKESKAINKWKIREIKTLLESDKEKQLKVMVVNLYGFKVGWMVVRL